MNPDDIIDREDFPAVDKFLLYYWNQMSIDIYADFKEAVVDFRAMEGDYFYDKLVGELSLLYNKGRLPRETDLKSARRDPFWKGRGRILIREDVEPFDDLLGPDPGSR